MISNEVQFVSINVVFVNETECFSLLFRVSLKINIIKIFVNIYDAVILMIILASLSSSLSLSLLLMLIFLLELNRVFVTVRLLNFLKDINMLSVLDSIVLIDFKNCIFIKIHHLTCLMSHVNCICITSF